MTKNFRSRRRIAKLGEVWTPPKVVNELLDLIEPKSVWADENYIFFEPTCGHGNFVIEVVRRRLKAFLKRAKKEKTKSPCFYSVANTLHNLRAVEISEKNATECRERVFKTVKSFLKEHCKLAPEKQKAFLHSCKPHILKNIKTGDFFREIKTAEIFK